VSFISLNNLLRREDNNTVDHVTCSSRDFDAIAIQQKEQGQLASVHTQIRNPKQPTLPNVLCRLVTTNTFSFQHNSSLHVSGILPAAIARNRTRVNTTIPRAFLEFYHNEVEQISSNKININKNRTSSGNGNCYCNNDHTNNSIHDEDYTNTVQYASPTLVSPALTYSSSTRSPFFGSFWAPWRTLKYWRSCPLFPANSTACIVTAIVVFL
jgi:hypothetical protein